ncbi:toxin-antitoxin system TumE family protein [Pyrococcus kukulkanii]|uniref:toxin-antitoxin system TumE family protein n=1 Tax=Pyrococcus kukulkanii TaxID=1609559 RepID=UPI003566025C
MERPFTSLKLEQNSFDGSVLYIREFVSEDDYKYSFQWQKGNKMLIRWDNAPHHKQIETFPHHKHIESSENIYPSTELSLEDVLKAIERQLYQRDPKQGSPRS